MDQEKIDNYRKSQEEERLRKEQKNVVDQSTGRITQTIKSSNDALKNALNGMATSADIDKVLLELKQTQLANYLSASQKKSDVILADSTSLGEAVAKLGEKLDYLAECMGEDKSDAELVNAVREEMGKVVNALNSDSDSEMITAIQELKTGLSNINVEPVVNVTTPDVKIDAPKVDLKPLMAKMDAVVKAVGSIKIPVSDQTDIIMGLDKVSQTINNLTFPVANFVQDPYIQYKAVDEFDDGVATNVKYYGFLEPRGNWYILKNDPSASAKTYRYAFGDSGYEDAWTNRASQTYGYPFGK